MACFVAPAVEAIAITTAKKIKAHQMEKKGVNVNELTVTPFTNKTKYLEAMLYGGSAILLVEHIYHGEVSFVFPFFTALKSADTTLVMLREIATTGVLMSVAVTLVWAVGCLLLFKFKKHKLAKKGNR